MIQKALQHAAFLVLSTVCLVANAQICVSSALGTCRFGDLGISSGSSLGISSGSTLGISSGSTLGISSGSLLGISSGSSLGISSGSKLGISSTLSHLTGGGSAGGGDSQQLVAFGPIDRIDESLSVIEILGQTIAFSGLEHHNLSVGTLVSVFGHVLGEGYIVGTAIVQSTEPNIPGATPLYVSGYLSAVDPAVGTLRIGGLVVSYTNLLSRGDLAIGDGIVSVTGIQPISGGVVLASAVGEGFGESTLGISSGSILGISSGSRLGISSGSHLGISGGSQLGISTGSMRWIENAQ